MAEDIPSQPFVYEGLDPSPASKSAIEEVSDAIRGAASRVGDAIEKGQKPGMPLSMLSNIAREAPLGSLLVAFLRGRRFARLSWLRLTPHEDAFSVHSGRQDPTNGM